MASDLQLPIYRLRSLRRAQTAFFYAKRLFIQYEARLHARAVDALHENSLDVRGF